MGETVAGGTVGFDQATALNESHPFSWVRLYLPIIPALFALVPSMKVTHFHG